MEYTKVEGKVLNIEPDHPAAVKTRGQDERKQKANGSFLLAYCFCLIACYCYVVKLVEKKTLQSLQRIHAKILPSV